MFKFIFLFAVVNVCQPQNVDVWLTEPNRNSWFNQEKTQNFANDTGSNPYTIYAWEAAKFLLFQFY